MSKVLEFNNLEKYLKLCSSFRSIEETTQLWFRGQERDWELKPGIYRSIENNKQFKERKIVETSLIDDFYVYSPLQLGRVPTDGWEWLTIMQHRRLPTRLLDWSENRLQALFFALSSWESKNLELAPIIYVMNPLKLNEMSVKNSVVYIAENKRLAYWLPETLRFFNQSKKIEYKKYDVNKYKGTKPIAIYVQHVDSRIADQKGCFTLHGSNYKSLQKIWPGLINELRLNVTNLDTKKRAELKAELLSTLDDCGVNEYTTYGNLDSLSDYLKRLHIG